MTLVILNTLYEQTMCRIVVRTGPFLVSGSGGVGGGGCSFSFKIAIVPDTIFATSLFFFTFIIDAGVALRLTSAL